MAQKRKTSHLAKLTPTQVRRARQMVKRGVKQSAIALAMNVSQATMSNLLAGRTYRKVL